MKRRLRAVALAVTIAALIFGAGARTTWAQAIPGSNSPTTPRLAPQQQADGESMDSYSGRVRVEAISDTLGVEFGPYLRALAAHLRASWPAFLPEAAKNLPAGSVSVDFEIPPDGKLGKKDPQIQTSSGDAGIDKGAIYAIGYWKPLDPLPTEFRGTGLKVRAIFYYGKDLDVTMQEPAPRPDRMPTFQGMGTGVDILSDTQGVDFRDYIVRMLAEIKKNWMAVMPESARMGTKGAAIVTFSVMPNGTFSADRVELVRASGTKELDKAALDAMRNSEPLDMLPAQFHGPYLKLRLMFLYNERPQDVGRE